MNNENCLYLIETTFLHRCQFEENNLITLLIFQACHRSITIITENNVKEFEEVQQVTN